MDANAYVCVHIHVMDMGVSVAMGVGYIMCIITNPYNSLTYLTYRF